MFQIFNNKVKNTWSWTVTFKLTIDFAIWVLEQDGLQVPPFTKYPKELGNGKLQSKGLTADKWLHWLHNLVEGNLEGELATKLATQERNLPELQPYKYFQGSQEIQDELENLWKLYLPLSNARRYSETHLQSQISDTPLSLRKLWNAANDAAGDLPPLEIILIGYPIYVEYVIAPSAVILATGGNRLLNEDFQDFLLRVIDSLNEHPDT